MREEITQLQHLLVIKDYDYYIVPTADFHGSEFINDHFKAREYLSGFTGSAGTLLVSRERAMLWTDGRYFLQAEKELAGSGIELMKSGMEGVPRLEDFLEQNLSKDQVLGFDGRLISKSMGDLYISIAEAKGAIVRYDEDLVDSIWFERPELKGNKVVNYPITYAGVDFNEKIHRIRYVMDEQGFDYHIIPGLEDNAWLYNLRGSDVERTPVFFSFTLITPTSVYLYGFKNAFEGITLPQDVTLKDYMEIFDDVEEIPDDSKVLVPFPYTSIALVNSISSDVDVVNGMSPISSFKAIKNHTEISSTEHAHIDDGVAMVTFLAWLDENIGKEEITELDAANKLEECRRAFPTFRDLSFDTICGYGENGAIIHYSPTEETNATLKPEGLLLLDSGGQYINGTTDITRTIVLGPLTDEMKKCYTAVLKSHIALASAVFEPGTKGTDLDELARIPVREIGLDYNHGTGHGVGHYLSVHEGPNNFSPLRGGYPIYPGMITTDEPGVYLEDKFGVRLENELLCEKNAQAKLKFRPLTLCPFDYRAINAADLTEDELDYLNAYHSQVYSKLHGRLSHSADKWLKKMTAKITRVNS